MRQLFIATVAAVVSAGIWTVPVQAGKVEMSGVHLCCKRCVTIATEALTKVDGISDVKCDQKAKTVTFTSKDAKGTEAGIKALLAAGYYGKVTDDGKGVAVETPAPKKGDKADEITVKDIHICCGQCERAITALFKDAKVTFSGTGSQKDIKLSGKGLEKAAVLETLQKAGFTGRVE
jgi:copper chaperone CopZ